MVLKLAHGPVGLTVGYATDAVMGIIAGDQQKAQLTQIMLEILDVGRPSESRLRRPGVRMSGVRVVELERKAAVTGVDVHIRGKVGRQVEGVRKVVDFGSVCIGL